MVQRYNLMKGFWKSAGRGPAKPLVSACIPTRNGARWIRETLESLLAQDYRELEIIVGDDASTDGTADIAANLGDSRIQVHRFGAWSGLGSNWNRTLRLATGEFVAVVCQDDVVDPRWASKLAGLLLNHPEADLAFCRRRFRLEDDVSRRAVGEFFERLYPQVLDRFYSSIAEVVPAETMVRESLKYLFEINLVGEPSFAMMRRSAKAIGEGFDESLRQMIDWEFFTRFFIDRPVLHCPEVLGFFRLHEDGWSVASSSKASHYKEYDVLLGLVIERFGRYLTAEQRRAVDARIVLVRELSSGHDQHGLDDRSWPHPASFDAILDALPESTIRSERTSGTSQRVEEPVIVIGAHRSGTSLGASLLASAGVGVGDRLMEGNWSNPRGHFEDMDFVEFHRATLVELGLHQDGWLISELPDMPEHVVARARALVARKRQRGQPWGWKDPRTVLYLPLWRELVPGATYAIVYRAPWEVVESLYMRGDAIFMEDPELAVKIWLYYNRALLRLASEVPDRCVLVNVETIGRAPAAWIAAVSECSGVQLDAPQDAIYEPDLLHRALARDRAGVIFRHFPEAVDLYAALERRAFRPAGTDPIPWDRGATPEEERRLAVRDWQRLCAHRRIATK